jgi:hypothetical protein
MTLMIMMIRIQIICFPPFFTRQQDAGRRFWSAGLRMCGPRGNGEMLVLLFWSQVRTAMMAEVPRHDEQAKEDIKECRVH